MLLSPPRPGFQANVQNAARAASWVALVGTELGRLDGFVLTVESANGTATRWAVEQGDKLPHDFADYFMSADVYHAIRDGEITQDGRMIWKGQRYALQASWDGARHIACLVQV